MCGTHGKTKIQKKIAHDIFERSMGVVGFIIIKFQTFMEKHAQQNVFFVHFMTFTSNCVG